MGLGGLDLLAHTQQAAGQGGSDGQVGVGINTGKAVFDAQVLGGAVGHPERGRSVIKTPAQIDRRGNVGCQPAVGIHVRRVKTDQFGRVTLQSAQVMHHGRAGFALGIGEDVLTIGQGQYRLVDVQGTARLALHGLGHEGGVHVVL